MRYKSIFFLLCILLICGCKPQPAISIKEVNPADNHYKQVGVQENPVAEVLTSLGDFKIEIFLDKVPENAKNFISLSEKGFYDNLTFHRVIQGEIIQGGDPSGDGSGDAGYTINDEFDPSLDFNESGMVALANRGKNTGSSQFFITMKPLPSLNDDYTIFGKVTEGFDIVQNINNVMVDRSEKPIAPVIIKKIKIEGMKK